MKEARTGQATTQRVMGFDVARAFAILGMVFVHFALVLATERGSPDWLTKALGLLDGRAAAAFVILAGVGITLMTRSAVRSGNVQAVDHARMVLVRRGLLLLVLGFINLAIWPGDILRVYGVSFLLASRLITSSNRRLLLGALGYAAGFVSLLFVLDFEKNWDWATLTYRGLWTPTGLVRNLFYDGFRSVLPWTGFVLFGMWLGRLDLTQAKINRNVLPAALATALAAAVVSWALVAYFSRNPHGMDAETVKALFGTESMPALPLFLLASGGEAVALIALCIRLTNDKRSRMLQPLVDTGRMALTWYFVHIVFGLGTIVALELQGTRSLPMAVAWGLGFFSLVVVASWRWMRTFRFGPLEWALRTVSG
jgi:uncharacterized protein